MEGHAETNVARDILGKALRQINKPNQIVGDILDVSKIQAGKLQKLSNARAVRSGWKVR